MAWGCFHLRPRLRLSRRLQAARSRLDRPPTAALGKKHPTRDELIAHLKTAGRRFAREYWTEGLAIFFPDLAPDPLPEEFCAPSLDS